MRFALLLLIIFAGCQVISTAPGSPQVRVEIERSTVRLDPAVGSATIAFSVRNIGTETVYVARCGGSLAAAFERRESGGWVNAGGGMCLTIYDMSPLALERGEVRRDTLAIQKPGRYRLRIGVSGGSAEQIAWKVVSEPFVVE